MSLLDPFACGFARAAAYEAFSSPVHLEHVSKECVQTHKARVCSTYLFRFNENFANVAENFTIDYKNSLRVFPVIKQKFNDWRKRHQTEVTAHLNTFST